MELFLITAIFAIPVMLGVAIVSDFQGIGRFFIKDGGKRVSLAIKITGWAFIILPLYPIIYETATVISGGR